VLRGGFPRQKMEYFLSIAATRDRSRLRDLVRSSVAFLATEVEDSSVLSRNS